MYKTRRLFFLLATFFSLQLQAATWHVGPNRTHHFCSEVAPLVNHGDTVWIDAYAYMNDEQVTWAKNNLYIAGFQGRPRLVAGPKIAGDLTNGKGIFVVRGSGITLENIEFAHAIVVDHNGAGIRQEGANMKVVRCRFDSNEMGILAGNIANCTTTIEYCEFVNGGSTANPGYQHNVYINHIDTLIFQYNYSHDAIAEGHELKSRAKFNFILYNRISNEKTVDSRNIDIPNGGTCVIMGNIIEQGQASANSNIIGYGLEGFDFMAPDHLYIVNNTLVNKKNTGSFIQMRNGSPYLNFRNNIAVGAKTAGLILGQIAQIDSSNNYVNSLIQKAGFVDAENFNYHLLPTSPAVNGGKKSTITVEGIRLVPEFVYIDTCLFAERFQDDKIDIGALEYFIEVSTKEVLEGKIIVSPNPFSDYIHVYTDQTWVQELILFDIHGRMLQRQQGNELTTYSLEAGVYFLKVVSSSGDSFHKIIKL